MELAALPVKPIYVTSSGIQSLIASSIRIVHYHSWLEMAHVDTVISTLAWDELWDKLEFVYYAHQTVRRGIRVLIHINSDKGLEVMPWAVYDLLANHTFMPTIRPNDTNFVDARRDELIERQEKLVSDWNEFEAAMRPPFYSQNQRAGSRNHMWFHWPQNQRADSRNHMWFLSSTRQTVVAD